MWRRWGGSILPLKDDEIKDNSAPIGEVASSPQLAEKELRETRRATSSEMVGRLHLSAQHIMGEQVANNREMQEVMYLRQDKGKWYILSEPKSPGLVKKEYLPIGNRLVYPKKWGRKRAAELLLGHLISENKKICEVANKRLEYLQTLSDEVTSWD